MSKKRLYYYNGPAYIQNHGQLYPIAFDEEGRPKLFEKYIWACSDAQAASLVKFYVRNKYKEHKTSKLYLMKNKMYVKND